MYIGVYGTLKKGQHANWMLANSPFIGEFRTDIPFQMYNLGAYPALIADEESHPITLEVYAVTDEDILNCLNTYEGYPSLYQKSEIMVDKKEWTEAIEVTIYTMKNNHKDRFMSVVESGNWK